MVDHISPERRSWLMSRVAGKDTAPELRVRRAAHKLGLRFRLHKSDLPGKPDLTFSKHRTVIFVHGCFWHRHADCSKASTPKTDTETWVRKFQINLERDAAVQASLQRAGWAVKVIWECETKDPERLEASLRAMFNPKL